MAEVPLPYAKNLELAAMPNDERIAGAALATLGLTPQGLATTMPEITMPRLSDSMEEGTILRWLVADGAEVARGDEIAEIETDKANMTYEADAAGVFTAVAAEGDALPVGALIAHVLGDGESPTAPAAAAVGRRRRRRPVAGRGDFRGAGRGRRPRRRRPPAATAAGRARGRRRAASRRRRSRGGSRASWASTSPRSPAAGPAGGS